jgi:protein TonB
MSGDEPIDVQTTVRVNFRLADGTENHDPRTTQEDLGGVPQLMQVSKRVMQRLLENKVDPAYPTAAKEQHIEGTVVLNLDANTEGSVFRVELVSGHPMLALAAMDAVLQWEYRPFVLNGNAVPVETTVQLKFPMTE